MRSAVAALGLFTAWLLSWGSGVGSANGPVLTAYLMSGLPYLAPHLSLYIYILLSVVVLLLLDIHGMLYILYTVYPVSLILSTLSLYTLYTLYPLYTPSILLYAILYILGPSDYWIWDGMDPGTPLDMAYIGYPR